MKTDTVQLVPGLLDLLVLKTVSLGAEHGYGILLRIEQISGSAFSIEQGALYPALYRLESQGYLSSEWGTSENNRRAKFYSLTSAGQRRLEDRQKDWNSLVSAMSNVLSTTPETT